MGKEEDRTAPDAAPRHGAADDTRRRTERRLLVAVLAAVGLFVAVNRAAEHRATGNDQGALLLSQSQTLDATLERQLRAVDGVLRRTAAERGDPAPALAQRLQVLAASLPLVDSLVWLDAEGRVRAASVPEWAGRSFADQPFFRAARERPSTAELQLGTPGPGLLGHATMPVTLPLATPDGRFDGVLSAGLDPAAISTLLRSILHADDAWAGVGHGAGISFVNEPPAAAVPAGTSLDRPGSFYRRHRDSGLEVSLLDGVLVTTGERRLMAQRFVRPAGLAIDQPLAITVSRRVDALYAPWWRETVVHAALYGALVLAAAFGLATARRRDRAVARLAAGERRAAQRLELARRGADLGLWETDLVTGVGQVDEHWNGMLGLPHESLDPGTHRWRSLVHPQDWPRVEAAVAAMLDGRSERFDETFRMRHADGRWIWVLDRGQVVERDAAGRPLRAAGTHLDVTVAMDRLQALQDSEERMQRLLEHLRAGVAVHDAEGRLIDANPAACELLGLTLEQLRADWSGDLPWTLLEDDGTPMPVERLPVHQVRASGAPVHGVVVGLQHRGRTQPVWLLADAFPRTGADGAFERIVVTFVDISGRKAAEAELRLLAAAVARLNDVVLITDGNLDPETGPLICFVNDAFERLTGWRRDEVLGRSPRLLLGPDTDPAELDRLGAALRRGEAAHAELVNYTREGRPYWVEVDVVPISDRSGRMTHLVTVHRDVTGRRQDRERLERARADLQATLEAVPDLLFDVDIDGVLHAFHSPRHDLLLRAPEEFLGRRLQDVLPPEAAATVMLALREALREGTSTGARYALDVPAGRRCFELSVARKPATDGEGARFIAIARDISGRIAAEQGLQRLNRSLRVLGRFSAGPAEGEDEAGYLGAVCRAAVETGGYLMAWIGVPDPGPERRVRVVAQHGEELAALRAAQISWDAARPEGRGPAGEALRTGRTQVTQDWETNENVAPWRAVALRAGCRSSIALPVVAGGQVLAVLILYATEHDAFRPDEVGPLEELARSVALGIVSLRSRRERDEAADASRAKSAFLANMSHEIRTPLNAILGLNYLLRRDGVAPQQAARLDRIDAAGHHLLSLVNDVLDLSKIEAGRMALESTHFHLSAVLDNVQSLIGEAARAKGLAVQVDAGDVPPWLRGDPTRLRQALLNLASNAVKFTERGQVLLRASLLPGAGDELVVRFAVEDTGIGIAAEELPRLFQPFEQADTTTTRRFGGTGLGLAITQRLAGLMGGECGGDSRPGEGSTFWFTARLQRGHGVLPPPPAARPAGADARLRAAHRGTPVLLAEDNEVNRELATALLHGAGLAVDEATNGREAVALAAARRYALVLMDLQMPVMGGLEATRAIRALPGGAQVPIVALTANAFDEDRRACVDAGMDDFIAKPMDVQAFYATVLRWLEGGGDGNGEIAGAAPAPLPAPAPAAQGAARPAAEAAAVAEAVVGRLSRLPGLDLARGLALTQGERGPYLAVLRRFARGDERAALEQALRRADREAAERAAHSMRGAAASLGHDAIAADAGSIERALAPGSAVAVEPDAFAIELARLDEALAALAAALDEGSAAPA